jgi:hypothetical protein
LVRQAVLLQHPGQGEVGRGAGRAGGHGLALQVADLGDAGLDHHAVGAIALVELEDLRGGHAVGVPHHPGFHRGGGALHVARGDGQVAVLLRDLLDRHVEPVLLEDAGFLGQRQRREAGPAGNADGDLGLLRVGGGRAAATASERANSFFMEGFSWW